jgi:hypothetical protein
MFEGSTAQFLHSEDTSAQACVSFSDSLYLHTRNESNQEHARMEIKVVALHHYITLHDYNYLEAFWFPEREKVGLLSLHRLPTSRSCACRSPHQSCVSILSYASIDKSMHIHTCMHTMNTNMHTCPSIH